MVTRKPVGPPLSTSTTSPTDNANPPYPTTPTKESAKSTAISDGVYSTNLETSPAFDLVDVKSAQQQQRARSDSDASSHGTWDSDDDYREHDTPEEADMPKPLQIRPNQHGVNGEAKQEDNKAMLPKSLRVGPPQGQQPRSSLEGQRFDEAQSNPWTERNTTYTGLDGSSDSNNPYLRQNGVSGGDNSQSEWQQVKPPSAAPPPSPSAAAPGPPVELSAVQSPVDTNPPSDRFAQTSLHDTRPASWETAEVLAVPQQGQSPLSPVTNQSQAPDSQRPLSAWWQDPGQQPPEPPTSGNQNVPPADRTNEVRPEEPYKPPTGPPPPPAGSLIDHDDAQPSPSDPPPIDASQPSAARPSEAVPETPGTQLKRQRNEHYQIKHMNWYDTSNTQERSRMRRSPVLTQNANGPCPLLALVNALVLSTPPDLNTPLIEALRTREQVTLGLLLDAVFDELMSGRRGDTANQLPDVSELYSFLLALHTGMNVNPRFVTPNKAPRGSWDGHPTAMNDVHPSHRAQRKAGAFEETREMRLYSTFSIPLIHGWTAPPGTPAYEAFLRSAQTFEDAQNIQFLEPELEAKLRSEGLSSEEQQTLQDIQTIKAFLNTWPTQLSDFGLKAISESLETGQFAILFRNDHFSTIYKEPKHGALMTLVTDAGYAAHDEIVWESLVDVSGAASEMFSGDFRIVSHNQDARLNQGNSAGGESGWQTVQNRNRNSGQRASQTQNVNSTPPPPLPGPRPTTTPGSSMRQDDGDLGIPDNELQRKASEQEDHDLALALQLQEEEEDQHRQAEDRRRREQELSEQYLSNESEGPRPAVPPRRNGGRAGSGPTTAAAGRGRAASGRTGTPTARPPVTRPANNSADPEAPPTYEQAASDMPYRPAGSTAPGNMLQGNPLGAYDALRRTSGGAPQTPTGPSSPPYQGRRISRRESQLGGPAVPGSYNQPQRVNQAAGVKDTDGKCMVM